MLLAFPWLFVSFALYNAIAFATGNAGSPQGPFNKGLASFHMASGAVWSLSVGDLLVVLTLLFLFIEMLKSTRSLSISLVDRGLALALSALCVVEFIVRPEGPQHF